MHFTLQIFKTKLGDISTCVYGFLQIFVRALFDYDPQADPAIPCKDAGLEFHRGDVLQIVSLEDDTWWQARQYGNANLRAGLIPSRQLQER